MEKFKDYTNKKYFYNAHPIACYLLQSEARLKRWQLLGSCMPLMISRQVIKFLLCLEEALTTTDKHIIPQFPKDS